MKKNIWRKPIYLPYLHENLTEETLHAFEQKIGFQLPKSLVELLKNQNGGYIRYGLPDTPPMQIWGVGETYPALTKIADEFSPEDIDYLSFTLDGLVAFDGDGHYYHCLDYRQNRQNPQVSYIDIESDAEEIIAENFDEFLNLLELNTENLWVIKSEKPLTEMMQIIQNQLIIKIDTPNEFNQDYPKYRGKYGGHWLWFSSNEVPLTFARKGEKNFNQLKKYEGKTALRFPEINAKYTLIEIYNEEIAPKLTEELNGILEIVKLSDLVE